MINKNIYLTIFIGIILIGLASSSLGIFNQNECVSIRVLSNYSEVNISTITLGNTTSLLNSPMTNLAGQTFNYTYCDTSKPGQYVFDWYPCEDLSCVNDFTIGANLTLPIFLLIFSLVVLIVGFIFKLPPAGFFSGILFSITGIYIMIYGLGAVANLYTQIFSFIILAFGLLITFFAVLSMFGDSLGSKEEE